MNKTIIFDMDGTLNRFYDVDGWLEDLQNERVRPYLIAEPKVDMEVLTELLTVLHDLGWTIAITSWLAKNSTKEYDNEVRKAKIAWLNTYHIKYDEIHLVKYGTTKANCTRKNGGVQFLFDDNAKIRKGFDNAKKNRFSFDANEDITDYLLDLIKRDLDF